MTQSFRLMIKDLVKGSTTTKVCTNIRAAAKTLMLHGFDKRTAVTLLNKADSRWLGRVDYIGESVIVEVQSLSPETTPFGVVVV